MKIKRLMSLFSLLIFTMILLNCGPHVIPTQKEKDLVTLAAIYHTFANNPLGEKQEKILDGFEGHDLEFISHFIKEVCSNKGNPFVKKFASKPDSINLKYFYTIHTLNVRMFDKQEIDTLGISAEVFRKDFNYYEALCSYYRSIFATLVNKHDQQNLPAINFNLNELNLDNDIEKSIFFFQMMDMFHVPVLMTLNMQKDIDQAFKLINSIPKINSLDYYTFMDFQFDDVHFLIFKKERGLKEYYMPQYYTLLAGHFKCLLNLEKPKSELAHLFNNSILSESRYYQYFKNKKLLDQIKANFK